MTAQEIAQKCFELFNTLTMGVDNPTRTDAADELIDIMQVVSGE